MCRSLATLLIALALCTVIFALPSRPFTLSAPKRNDFESVDAFLESSPQQSVFLCPYEYTPVVLDPNNPRLRHLLSNLTQWFDSQFNFSKHAASAVMTYRGNIIWEWGKGVDPSTGRMASPDSIFRIGSLSKVFPALLGLLAESRGVVSLDDPVRAYIPELDMDDPFHPPDSPRDSSFSWRQLASHTAGMPREAPCSYHSCQRTTEEMLQRIRHTRLILPAAARPSYSNLGYAMLGHFIARVLKADYEALVLEQILKPLRMFNTSFDQPSRYVPPVPNMPLYDLGWLAPSGQMYSTARDLARLAIAINLASAEPFLFGNPRFGDDPWMFAETDQSSNHFFDTAANRGSSQSAKKSDPFVHHIRRFKDNSGLASTAHSRNGAHGKIRLAKSYSKAEISQMHNMESKFHSTSSASGFGTNTDDAVPNASNPTGIFRSLLRELMYPTYMNPDDTGYGMPWEFAPMGPYFIRNKGGNLQGYSANIALVPELQLGLTITTNFATDASEWATYNLGKFIPEFERILDPLQDMPATTGQPMRYVGRYSPSTEISINEHGYLSITKLKGLAADIPIVPSTAEPNNPAVLQIYLPQFALPCMDYEFAAIGYEYVTFTLDARGIATSFTIPGLMYADTFTRIE